MHKYIAYTSLLLALAATSCAKAKKAQEIAKKVDALEACFPDLFPLVDGLFAVAETWRMQTPAAPDPAGLTWSEQGDGSVNVAYTQNSVTLTVVIRFYSPTGTLQDLDLSAATSLSEAIDLAATELATLFGNTDKFMTADWVITGGTSSGSGQLTGIIGGTVNQNELEELRTTTGTPAGGPPPVAPGTVSNSMTNCTMTFQTASLQTDTVVNQQYPIGTITITLTSPETTVTATIVFNNTVIAVITASDVPGSFDYNIDTGDISYNN